MKQPQFPNISFVVGYPRSRTAWLAEAATCHTVSIGTHETFQDGSMDRFRAECKVAAAMCNAHTVVECNSALLGPRLQDRFLSGIDKSNAVLLVLRDANEAKAAYVREFGKLLERNDVDIDWLWESISASIELVREISTVKTVDYNDLGNPETVMECMRHLIPFFPDEKIYHINALMGRRITQIWNLS